jgi:hypothetical protein
MRIRYLLIALASAAVCGPAMAGANILPGSGATVAGSSLHDGFNESAAAGNLINGTTDPTFGNGDTRWVFADGSSADQTLIVDFGSDKSVDFAGFAYSGEDRTPISFEILTSTDGTHFTAVGGPTLITPGSPGVDSASSTFAPTLAQYVEYDFGANSTNEGCAGCGGGPGQGAGIVSLNIGAVPEPATWAMMLFGVGMIGGGLRLTRRKSDVAGVAT